MAKTGDLLYKIRAITVFIFFIGYSTFLWLKLVDVGEKTNHHRSDITIALILWAILFIVCQSYFTWSALSERPLVVLQKTWINVPMLLFIIFNLPPYGFTLKHMYELAECQDSKTIHVQGNISNNNTTIQQYNKTCPCNQKVPMIDFILLQMVMPVLLLTFIIYPLPRRAYATSEYVAIAVEFMNAFDIMDMVGDFAFVQHYGIKWEVSYYISLGMSVILISFPIKVEMVSSQSDTNIDINHSMTTILETQIAVDTDQVKERRYRRSSSLPTLYKRDIIGPLEMHDQNLSSNGAYDCTYNKETIGALNNNSRISIERETTDKEDIAFLERQTYRQILKVLLTMVFTDMMFASLRFKIMVEESSAEYAFNMIIKNLIVACLHMSYLLQYLKHLFVSRLFK